jgi:hypothetical protein
MDNSGVHPVIESSESLCEKALPEKAIANANAAPMGNTVFEMLFFIKASAPLC